MKIFKKTYYQKNLMKQIYFIITLIIILAIWILPLNSEITFAQNETSEIEDSLITTEQIDKSMETNNTSPQADNNIPLIK
jgi:hypothetical protein